MNVWEVLTSIGTIGLAFFSLLMWLSTRDASKKTLRAYIGVDEQTDPDKRRPITNKGNCYTFVPIAVNFGKTPAIGFAHASAMEYLASPPDKESFQKLKFTGAITLQPSQAIYLTVIFEDKSHLWQEITHRIKRRGGWVLYMYGCVTYYDIYRNYHYTRYCYSIEFSNGPNGVPGWHIVGQFNDTDDTTITVCLPFPLSILQRHIKFI
jgi:hypothetical protein